MRPLILSLATLSLVGCERAGPEDPAPVTPRTDAAIGDPAAPPPAPPPPSPTATAAPAEPRLVAQALVLAEWQEADNRGECAPLAFASTGQARGAPRSADFADGWAVAFDLPNLRSAFGVAGPGVVAADRAASDAQRARLQEQWPYFRDLGALPQPAFAGYGIEGAARYPPGNPNGRGVNSLAYVRVGSQVCTYNVWSRLGRVHLETLLDALRSVPVD